jgi:hypothetical protein
MFGIVPSSLIYGNTLSNINASNISGGASLTNLYVSNSITTTNILAAGFTSNATTTIFNGDTLIVPYINTTYLTATGSINVQGTVASSGFYGAIYGSNLVSASNIYSANALQTTNIFTTNLTAISNISGATINATGFLINGVSGTTGQVIIASGTGAGITWGTGGGGSSQWQGTTGNPIYYVPNVGIGSTATPTSNLQVTGNIYISNTITTVNDIYSGTVRIGRGANLVDTDTVLGTRVLLNDTGICDTAIGYQSMQNAQPYDGYDTAIGANTLLIDTGSGYNVAIGSGSMISASPRNGQDVAIGYSTLQIDGTDGIGLGFNTAVGTYSMQNANPASGYDTAVGSDTLTSDTGLGYNVAIGSGSMTSASPTQGQDVAIGFYTLRSDSGPGYNIAVGTFSMQNSHPFAGYDTAVGTNTLSSDTGPGYNVAIGSGSMISASPTQGQDVAIGYYTLQSDGGSGYNTAVGTYSMQNASPGGNDVAIGYYTLYNDHGPGYNTAVGGEAMQSANPGGGYDTAIGWQALQSDTGSYNTAIGANAGQGITGGQNNTALGAGSGPYSGLLNNTTAIGSNAQPTVSDVAVFPYGINVGINTGAPGSSLEIQGNLYVSNSLTTSNVIITGNVIPASSGNTYFQGNVVVAGNVYSSLGQLGVGGSLYFSLGSTYTPSAFTGTIPNAGTPTYKLRLDPFTRQGSSTFIKVSPNGCLQFSQTGVYSIAAVFLTDFNNVLGMGIGSNVSDSGTRTDQTYLYSIVPFLSQNPTEVLETQFYVSSTSLYYYIDLFAIDGVTLQPTSAPTGGTWITIAPLGGTSAAVQSITLSTLGNIVTGQSVNYGALITDYYIGMTNGGTVVLPIGSTLTAGKTYVIKDESGLAGIYTSSRVTIQPTAPNLIDGQTSAIIVINYASISVLWTGSTWSIF